MKNLEKKVLKAAELAAKLTKMLDEVDPDNERYYDLKKQLIELNTEIRAENKSKKG